MSSCRSIFQAAGHWFSADASVSLSTMTGDSNTPFECVLCGECCREGQKVWLNPTDLERLAAHLGLEGGDALAALEEKHIVVVEPGQNDVFMPRLRFPPTPAGRSCRFLMNDMGEDGRLRGRCTLHYTDAKPLVCRLAPLARTVDLDDGSEEWREVPPVAGCPGWTGNSPPIDGRLIVEPELPPELRADLDAETEYFRECALRLESSGEDGVRDFRSVEPSRRSGEPSAAED